MSKTPSFNAPLAGQVRRNAPSRYLFFSLFALMPALAEAASYYAAPAGSGTTCSNSNPCQLDAGLDKARPGDELVLKDGVYNASIKTRATRVTIRAENTHKAILRSTTSKLLASIEHDGTVVRGIRFDGKPTINAGKGGLMRVGVITLPYVVRNVIIEGNIFENSHAAGIGVQHADSIIIRHNVIQETGFSGPGEALYLGDSSGGPLVKNVEIYGNVLRRFTSNGIDFKPNTQNVGAHHNIFEEQHYKDNPFKKGLEGTIVTRSDGAHRIHDNIFRNIIDAGPSPLHMAARGGHKAYKNVLYNITSSHTISTREPGSGSVLSELTGNTFCNMKSYSINNPNGMKISNNPGLPGGAPQSACNAEEQRIMNEMKSLPGAGSPLPSPSPTPLPTPPQDTVAPTVSLTAPASGASLSGTGNVTATASDNVGVAGVQFKVDGKNIGAEDTASPYSVSLDTRTLTNGSHTLTATARDAAGNTATAAGRSISVTNGSSGGGGGTTPPMPPSNSIFAVNAGGGAYTARDGTKYRADAKFSGGRVYTKSAAIANTTDDPLYRSERYGNFSYAIPLANGNYKVTLKLAEIYWSAKGKRQFDVKAEGKVVVSNLDLVARAGANTAYDVTVPVSVQDGTLNLQFLTDINNAKVSAILVAK
jgi:hypothetical protein